MHYSAAAALFRCAKGPIQIAYSISFTAKIDFATLCGYGLDNLDVKNLASCQPRSQLAHRAELEENGGCVGLFVPGTRRRSHSIRRQSGVSRSLDAVEISGRSARLQRRPHRLTIPRLIAASKADSSDDIQRL